MATATARVTVLMPPEDKAALVRMARRAGLSIGELVRRAVAAQLSDAELERRLESERSELESLLARLEASHRAALRSVDGALERVDAVLARLGGRGEAEDGARRADL